MSPRGLWSVDPENPDLDVAISVMGNRNKMLVLRFLYQHGASPRVAIEKATDIQGPTLSLNLRQLEEAGVVASDLPPGESRRGRVLTYSLNRDRLRQLSALWVSFVSGGEGGL